MKQLFNYLHMLIEHQHQESGSNFFQNATSTFVESDFININDLKWVHAKSYNDFLKLIFLKIIGIETLISYKNHSSKILRVVFYKPAFKSIHSTLSRYLSQYTIRVHYVKGEIEQFDFV